MKSYLSLCKIAIHLYTAELCLIKFLMNIKSDPRKGLGWSDCSKINVITRVYQPLGLNIKYEDKQLILVFIPYIKCANPNYQLIVLFTRFVWNGYTDLRNLSFDKKGILTDDPYDEYNDFVKVWKKVFRIGK